jgi:hypothetical protein
MVIGSIGSVIATPATSSGGSGNGLDRERLETPRAAIKGIDCRHHGAQRLGARRKTRSAAPQMLAEQLIAAAQDPRMLRECCRRPRIYLWEGRLPP